MIKIIVLVVFVILNTSQSFKIVNDLDWEEMKHWAAYDRVGQYLGMVQAMSADSMDMNWLPNSNKIGLGYNPVRYTRKKS